YYGTPMPINQCANVTLADARTITVQPWEKKMVQVIEKAIRDSDLGLNPATSGDLIRVPMPALTEERRRDLIKVVRHEAENARIAVRNIRRDANEHLKKLLKDHAVAEDDERRAQEDVQKLTDRHIAEIDKILAAKEADLMAICSRPSAGTLSRLDAIASVLALLLINLSFTRAARALFKSSTRDIPETRSVPRHVAIIMD